VPVQLVTIKNSGGQSTAKDAFETKTFVRGEDLTPYEVSYDLSTDINLETDDPTYACWTSRSEHYRHGCDCRWDKSDASLHCLKLATLWNNDYGNTHSNTFFLVLKPTAEDGTYERVGIGDHYWVLPYNSEQSFWSSRQPLMFSNAATTTIRII
jgi:hypothetical protein